MVPVLEAPTGELIPESGIQMQYALDAAPAGQGLELIPSDPLVAAQMRVKMVDFDKKVLRHLFGVGLSRFQDLQEVDGYVSVAIPYIEELCPEVSSDKWLMGTDEMTLFDIHCGAMWDFFYVLAQAPAYSDVPALADLAQKSPKWWAYMQRFRAHPKLAPTCMKQDVAKKYA
mmetsp:Transcript_23754/g.29542  ORF Transcript_23754/g.29542 Transcript_23754/m.29542 type:complete len:172 (+) Transcript_23754:274-789(+)